jgi:hypothetical protein
MAMAMRWGGPVGAPPIELKAALDALEEDVYLYETVRRSQIGHESASSAGACSLLLCVGFVLFWCRCPHAAVWVPVCSSGTRWRANGQHRWQYYHITHHGSGVCKSC